MSTLDSIISFTVCLVILLVLVSHYIWIKPRRAKELARINQSLRKVRGLVFEVESEDFVTLAFAAEVRGALRAYHEAANMGTASVLAHLQAARFFRMLLHDLALSFSLAPEISDDGRALIGRVIALLLDSLREPVVVEVIEQ